MDCWCRTISVTDARHSRPVYFWVWWIQRSEIKTFTRAQQKRLTTCSFSKTKWFHLTTVWSQPGVHLRTCRHQNPKKLPSCSQQAKHLFLSCYGHSEYRKTRLFIKCFSNTCKGTKVLFYNGFKQIGNFSLDMRPAVGVDTGMSSRWRDLSQTCTTKLNWRATWWKQAKETNSRL